MPVGGIDFEDVKIPLQKLADIHGFEFINEEIKEIKAKEKKVITAKNTYTFEYLIIAIGADKVKHPGIENTLSICGRPEEALEIKKRYEELVKKGSGKLIFGFGGNPKDPSGVRGGPAFEVMFNIINDLKKRGLRDKFEITFYGPMPRPGARMGEKALKIMDDMFKKMNIKKIAGIKPKEFQKNGILLENGEFIESDLTMFIPAGTGPKIFKNSDLPLNEAGFIEINEYCEVKHNIDETSSEKYNIFAIGDSAAIDGPDWRAKQGHLAEVMAKVTAYNIEQMEKGSEKRAEYISHINILCLMDMGNGGAFVYRDNKRAILLPLFILGHWMKRGWGWYYKNSKLKKIPRIPGM